MTTLLYACITLVPNRFSLHKEENTFEKMGLREGLSRAACSLHAQRGEQRRIADCDFDIREIVKHSCGREQGVINRGRASKRRLRSRTLRQDCGMMRALTATVTRGWTRGSAPAIIVIGRKMTSRRLLVRRGTRIEIQRCHRSGS
jgi:hypothetical protein